MPAVKRQKQELLQIIRSKFEELIPRLNRSEDGHIFEASPLGLPNYSSLISHPMCVNEMKSKATSVYTTIDELALDLELMCDNCVVYNGQNSKWAAIAMNLLSVGRILIQDLKTEITELETHHKQEAAKLRKNAEKRLKNHPMVKKMQAAAAAAATSSPQVKGESTKRSPTKEVLKEEEKSEPAEESVKTAQPSPPRTVATPVHDEGSIVPKELPSNRVGTELIVPEIVRRSLRHEIRIPDNNTKITWTCEAILASFRNKVLTRDICLDVETTNYSLLSDAIISELNNNIARYVTASERSIADFPISTPTQTFGADLLLRLLVSMPTSLTFISDSITTAIILVIEELLQFVAANWSIFQSIE
eukprot:TRINITY_DN5153_c0_g2_i1.p1 TRINITY_DN5153_c0_g2~~TRINITY_DN5153_c0_g2_i1.p1  ORF type:complete len:388 (+),score=66.47 TRINITY_DN5153_c0_g2_i1:81-1166(+)